MYYTIFCKKYKFTIKNEFFWPNEDFSETLKKLLKISYT